MRTTKTIILILTLAIITMAAQETHAQQYPPDNAAVLYLEPVRNSGYSIVWSCNS